jgi:predicted DNA-binding mobile mystery protein A
MKLAERASKARRTLDQRFQAAGNVRLHLAVPVKGWIRAIRESLGMTAVQLAARMGVVQSSVTELEKAEARGAAQLSSLKRAAEAMNCTLVYALVPNETLEDFLNKQARAVAREHLKPVEQTMLLENQSLTPEQTKEFIDDYIRSSLNPRLVWDKL